MQIQMSNLIHVPASLVFAEISELWFLLAFLIKINNKKPNQIISQLLALKVQ